MQLSSPQIIKPRHQTPQQDRRDEPVPETRDIAKDILANIQKTLVTVQSNNQQQAQAQDPAAEGEVEQQEEPFEVERDHAVVLAVGGRCVWSGYLVSLGGGAVVLSGEDGGAEHGVDAGGGGSCLGLVIRGRRGVIGAGGADVVVGLEDQGKISDGEVNRWSVGSQPVEEFAVV